MRTANMHKAKSCLSELVRAAEAGEEVIIARNGKPAVRLVPVSEKPVRRLGAWADHLSEQPPGWDEKIPPEEIFGDLIE